MTESDFAAAFREWLAVGRDKRTPFENYLHDALVEVVAWRLKCGYQPIIEESS